MNLIRLLAAVAAPSEPAAPAANPQVPLDGRENVKYYKPAAPSEPAAVTKPAAPSQPAEVGSKGRLAAEVGNLRANLAGHGGIRAATGFVAQPSVKQRALSEHAREQRQNA